MGSHLLRLPLELREQIYQYALCTHDARLVEPCYLPRSPFFQFTQPIRDNEPVEPRYPPLGDDLDPAVIDHEPCGSADDEEGSVASAEWEEEMERHKPAVVLRDDRYFAARFFPNDEDPEDHENDSEKACATSGHATTSRTNSTEQQYRIASLLPFELSLLRVNHQVNEEATRVFYRKTRIILDADSHRCINFLRHLSLAALQNITQVALVGNTLWEIGDSNDPWSGEFGRPIHLDPPMMFTPFGALLAELPRLTWFGLHVPFGGYMKYYAEWAPREIAMLAAHKLQSFSFMFSGWNSAYTLRTFKSSDCYEELMVGLNGALARHEFEIKYPDPRRWRSYTYENRALKKKHTRKLAAFLDENTMDQRFVWFWDDRDHDTTSDGAVQAVITFQTKREPSRASKAA